MDLSTLSRDDWLVGGGGIALMLDLLFLPWHHESVLLLGAATVSASQSATSSPDAFWGVLALLLTLLVVVDLALSLFNPHVRVPTTQLGRPMTRCAVAALVIFVLLLKLFAHTEYLGFGAFLGFVLAIAVVVGAYRHGQEAEL